LAVQARRALPMIRTTRSTGQPLNFLAMRRTFGF
ncbi:MAG: hypothetical protein ACI9XZ_004147, partial [Alphaproteobacteria bacterium]